MLSVSRRLQYITEQIADSDFRINVLVPSGASPETYEPSPAQMQQVAQSQFYIHTGLIDFERNLQQAIRNNMPDVQQINVSEGVELIAGDCEHNHQNNSEKIVHDHEVAATHGHTHVQGVDPHIWNSPRTVKQIAATIYEALARQYPDSARYKDNYHRFISRLDSLDSQLTALFGPHTHHAFIIYHPALTYLARDYGLQQIALENEGKEPSAEHAPDYRHGTQPESDQTFLSAAIQQKYGGCTGKRVEYSRVPIDPLARM
ncbi:MAG: metal ABC transporter solute-binding protein, Zn/Mn family [Alistipes indistinctus]